MTAFERTFHIGPDGKVNFDVPPELMNTDVRITVEPTSSTNGTYPPGTRLPTRTMTPDERRDLLNTTAGICPDFPDVKRPGPDTYRDSKW